MREKEGEIIGGRKRKGKGGKNRTWEGGREKEREGRRDNGSEKEEGKWREGGREGEI